MNEEIYIKGLHTGDQKIFRAIFEEYHTRLCYFAGNLLPDAAGAEDVVQEVFVKMWEKRNHFQAPGSIKAFLYIAVKNRCLNIYKHDKVIKKYGDLMHAEVDERDASSFMVEAEVLESVYQALQKLPAGCRNVLHLSYFQGLKNKDIATELKISINTVKTQKKRALHLLRGMLKVSTLWFLILTHYSF